MAAETKHNLEHSRGPAASVHWLEGISLPEDSVYCPKLCILSKPSPTCIHVYIHNCLGAQKGIPGEFTVAILFSDKVRIKLKMT